MVKIFVGSRRPCDSEAFATWSYDTKVVVQPLATDTFVNAAVSVVLPWSTCPIVPTLQCGFVRSNFCLAMGLSVRPRVLVSSVASGELRLNLGGNRRGNLFVVIELHGEGGAPLRHGAQVADIAEHVGERHHGVDHIGVAAHVLPLNLAASRVDVADHRTR